MKVVLATGIYPPQIGGPATYVRELARELSSQAEVVVVTYGQEGQERQERQDDRKVIHVPLGLPVLRWFAYARALRAAGSDADAVVCFSSVSAGVPLILARLRHPKRILRLGGDFFWERYTARGGLKSLADWYAASPLSRRFMAWLLRRFHHIVFSTRFQEELYEKNYRHLPAHSVIENAVPAGAPVLHHPHEPFRILFLGRFVGFKNLPALVKAVSGMSGVALTLAGDGPMKATLQGLVTHHGLSVTFLPPVHGEDKATLLRDQDLLVIPSVTEISPHTALEARAAGLPVLLSSETGLSESLAQGMTVAQLRSPEQIRRAIEDIRDRYGIAASAASGKLPDRSWSAVADEWRILLSSPRP